MVTVLPPSGIITIAELAIFLHTDGSSLQQRLTDKGIPVLKLSSKFDKRLVRLEDMRVKE
jgi:rRNA-processing protein FCF1